MNKNRTPTNRELLLKFAGLLTMLTGVVAIALVAVHLPSSSTAESILVLLSFPLLFVGYETLMLEPREKLDLLPVPVLTIIFASILGAGPDGLFIVLILSALSALVAVPIAIAMFARSFLLWRNSESITKGPRSHNPVTLTSGVTRAQGETYAARFRRAQDIFDNAQFPSAIHSWSDARRAPFCWRFDRSGATPAFFTMFRESLNRPRREWSILVVMVAGLPRELAQPAVIVVSDEELDKVVVLEDGITIGSIQDKIPAHIIRLIVAYRR